MILNITIQLLTILYTSHWIMCAVDDKLKCTDWNNQYIDDGQEFNPKKEDPCYVCICNNGYTERCKSVRCTAPTEPCDRYVPVEGACCEFKCLDQKAKGGGGRNTTTPVNRGSEDGSSDSITTLGLRLVASTVTSFLVLALLLFMVHRIRQRRLMLAMRRYHNNRRRDQLDDYDHDGFTQDYLGIQSPPPYEDPPPPYSPPKPPQRVLPSESPPPYESVDNNANINNNNNNNDLHCQTERSEMMYNNIIPFNSQRLDCSDGVTGQSNDPVGARSLSPCTPNINDCISELSNISFSENYVTYNPRSSCLASRYRPFSNTLNTGLYPFHMKTVTIQSPLSSSFCNQHHIPVLDRTDNLSSYAASDSFSPYPRRQCQENFSILQGYIPPHQHDGTDSDDLSTDMSFSVLSNQPVRNHTEIVPFPNICSLEDDGAYDPAKISYIDRQNSSMAYDNVTSSSGILNRFDTEVSEGHLDIQDVSVSDLCTSSVDNTLSKICTDSKQLREARLSNLLRSPSDESSEGPLSSVTVQGSSQNIPRSQSDVSMFSVCSETGEKKLLQIAALRNDAPYPDNICKGKQSLPMLLPRNQNKLNQIQLNKNEGSQCRLVNTKSRLENSECQKDIGEMMEKNIQSCDESRNFSVINGERNNKHDGNSKNTCILSDQFKFDKKSCVSEYSHSSSEKNCNFDTKVLIKTQQKYADRKDNSKKNTMGTFVSKHRKRNKHRVHRHSTESLPYRNQRSLHIIQNNLLPPFNHNMQVSTHEDNQPEVDQNNHSRNTQQPYKGHQNIKNICGLHTSLVHNPKSKKKITTKTVNTTEYLKKNPGKNPCSTRNEKSQYDSVNINSNRMETKFKGTMCGYKHLFDQQLSHISSKSNNDAILLCSASKGFSHRKNRNSRRCKNRKSYPGPVITETKVKDKKLMSSPVVSYIGVKKETEFSGDGVKEKLTFCDDNDLMKHADNNEDIFRREKCSYV